MSLLLLASLAMAQPTADYYSANALKRDCSDPARIEACFSFVAAVRDTSLAYQQWMKFQEFCLPSSLSIAGLRDATLHYLEVHGRDGDALAASVVLLALRDEYPCPAGQIAPGQAGQEPSAPITPPPGHPQSAAKPRR